MDKALAVTYIADKLATSLKKNKIANGACIAHLTFVKASYINIYIYTEQKCKCYTTLFSKKVLDKKYFKA